MVERCRDCRERSHGHGTYIASDQLALIADEISDNRRQGLQWKGWNGIALPWIEQRFSPFAVAS